MSQLKDTSIHGDCKISGELTVRELIKSLNKSIFYTNWSDNYTDDSTKNAIITNSSDNTSGAVLTIMSTNSVVSPKGWGIVANSTASSMGDGAISFYNNNLRKYLLKVSTNGDLFCGLDATSKVWHQNNDGSGSGLDADLLDGKHASAFLLLTGGTLTGSLGINAGDLIFTRSLDGIKWSMNSDGAAIFFKNDADSDADSYLCFRVLDNGNEYFKWIVQTSTSQNERMRLTDTELKVTGNIRGTRIYGAVYNDYAEYFEKKEEIEPGDVVELDLDSENEVYIKSTGAYSKTVVGVCSDEYFQCIGGKGDEQDKENYTPVGLAGRVKVKVIGKVNKGDFLVSSKIPGIAMAVTDAPPGTIIGKALENKLTDKIERVRMLIQLH